MNVDIKNIKFRNLTKKQDILKNYIDILKSEKKQDNKFFRPKLTVKTDEEVIKKYNL